MKRIFNTTFLLLLFFSPLVTLAAREPISHYEVLFSPEDKVAEELIKLIKQEKQSIRVAVYCLMHHGISKALIEAKKRGVSVEVVVDSFSVKNRSPLQKMAESGIPIYVWDPAQRGSSKKKKSLMHDKFCVFGANKVWTGSFNFTFDAATSNRENVIVFEHHAVANKYLTEFESLKKSGTISYWDYQKRSK